MSTFNPYFQKIKKNFQLFPKKLIVKDSFKKSQEKDITVNLENPPETNMAQLLFQFFEICRYEHIDLRVELEHIDLDQINEHFS